MPLKDLFNKSDTKDYDAAVVRDMPTYPGLTLTYHVLLKNVQVRTTAAVVAKQIRRNTSYKIQLTFFNILVEYISSSISSWSVARACHPH